MANSSLYDAVYIASPTSCHAEQALLFINAGKHVLCEKPVCSNLQELDVVLAAASERGVVFMEALRHLHTPNFDIFKTELKQIQPIRQAQFNFCQYSSRYPAYLEGKQPNAFKPELSNGALMDLGCYCVSACVALLGAPSGVSYAPVMLDTGVDGSGSLVLSYPDKIATLVFSKQSHGFNSSQVQVPISLSHTHTL